MKKVEKSPEQKFVEHIWEWDEHGIPYGMNDLRELARKYGTKIPEDYNKI